MFCPECGVDHHADDATKAKTLTEAEVRIAKIQADRDVEIARLNAGADVKVSEAYADEDAARVEGVVEGMETVIETMAPDPPPAVETEVTPVVIHETPDPELDATPPPAAEESHETKEKAKAGWWDNYA